MSEPITLGIANDQVPHADSDIEVARLYQAMTWGHTNPSVQEVSPQVLKQVQDASYRMGTLANGTPIKLYFLTVPRVFWPRLHVPQTTEAVFMGTTRAYAKNRDSLIEFLEQGAQEWVQLEANRRKTRLSLRVDIQATVVRQWFLQVVIYLLPDSAPEVSEFATDAPHYQVEPQLEQV